MDAENQKTESGREHQRCAALFNAAEQKVLLNTMSVTRLIKYKSFFLYF